MDKTSPSRPRWVAFAVAGALLALFLLLLVLPPLAARGRARALVGAGTAEAERLRPGLVADASAALSRALADLARDRSAPYPARSEALLVLTLTPAAHAEEALRDLVRDPGLAEALLRPAAQELVDRGVDVTPLLAEREARAAAATPPNRRHGQ